MRWATGLGTAAAVILVIAAPATGTPLGPDGQPFRSLIERRNAQVVRQNWDLSCGAAAVATLMTYQLRHPVSEHDVALAMLHRTSPLLVRARLGFSLLDLKIYAATQGFGATGFGQMTIADLDAIAPAVVPIRRHGFRHFVVYRGRRDDRVLLADPAFGNRTLSVDSFEAAWANAIAFIVYDPADPHAPNRMGAPAELFAMPGHQAERAAIAGEGP
jgi:predicted double-glycine peptidase